MDDVKETLDSVISEAKEELKNQQTLLSTNDIKLKEIVNNNIIALSEIIETLGTNYYKIIYDPSGYLLDMVYIKNIILDYKHIRITVLNKLK